MVRALCGAQLKGRKRVKDFMLILGLKEAMEYLASSMHPYRDAS